MIFCPQCCLNAGKVIAPDAQWSGGEWKVVAHEGGMLILWSGPCPKCGVIIRTEQHNMKLEDGSWHVTKVCQ